LEKRVAERTHKLQQANIDLQQAMKTAEEASLALAESERRYRGIFENSLAGIFQTTWEGQIIRVNPCLAQIVGYGSPREMMTSIADPADQVYLKHRDRQEFIELLKEQGKVNKFDTQLVRKDGSSTWVSISARTIIDEKTQESYIEGSLVDITERLEKEKAIREREAATEASKLKSEFLANMSHEIRTPMSAIIGLSQLALLTELTLKQENYLQKIQKSSNTLLGIINDILDFSKIEAGRLELEHIDFCLADVLTNLVDLLADQAEDKGLELIVQSQENIPPVLVGDPLRLSQILINLTSNAIKFTESGQILVGVEVIESEQEQGNGKITLQFIVQDSGIGIDSEQTERLFAAFSQADGSISRKYGGTGLGLSISKRLVAKMGGTIAVKSQPGQGSTFSFSAFFGISTIAESEFPSKKAPWPKSFALLNNAHILLVEDNEINQEVAEEQLKQAGLQVTVASNGREAVTAIIASHSKGKEQPPFAAILMDLHMPEMDGFEASRRIRKWEESNPAAPQPIPIIALTAHTQADYQEKCRRAGMSDFSVKPFIFAELMATLLKWIRPEETLAAADIQGVLAQEVRSQERNENKFPQIAGISISQGLARVSNNQQLYGKLLGIFLTRYADGAEKISNALETGEPETAQRLTHTVKGVAGNLGAEDLGAAAAYLEAAISAGNNNAIKGHLLSFSQALAQIIAALSRWQQEDQGPTRASQGKDSAHPVDISKARMLLQELAELLDEDMASAMGRLDPLRKLLANSEASTIFAELEAALEGFDIDRALEKIKLISGTLK